MTTANQVDFATASYTAGLAIPLPILVVFRGIGLVDRSLFDVSALGLYGYNAALAAVALYLWRRSLVPPLLGMLLTVPLTELVPHLGVPALTAPFVLATWLVLAFIWAEKKFLAV